jgi:hypothetical protein
MQVSRLVTVVTKSLTQQAEPPHAPIGGFTHARCELSMIAAAMKIFRPRADRVVP